MATKVIYDKLWAELTAQAKKAKKAFVAVAYIGIGATAQLPLKRGSLLITDLSEKSVKSGLTNPNEVLKYVKKGIEVHSVENLHAKVFVFDRKAIVGSSNISLSSKSNLIEAAMYTSDSNAIKEAKEFVISLKGDRIGPKALSELIKIYVPPRGGARKIGKQITTKPRHSSIWLFPLELTDYDEETQKHYDNEKPKAIKKLNDKSQFILDDFKWTGKKVYEKLKLNQRVLIVEEDNNGWFYLVPPCRVIHIKRWRKGTAFKLIVFLERLKNQKRIRIDRALRKLDTHSGVINNLDVEAKLVEKAATVYQLGQLWKDNK